MIEANPPAAPDWLVPGAPVLLYTDSHYGSRALKRTTVAKVATKSFTVTEPGEPRFNLRNQSAHGGGTWSNTRYVVPLDSDKARAELKALKERKQIARARTAVEAWERNRTRENRLAAIAALQAIENDEAGDAR